MYASTSAFTGIRHSAVFPGWVIDDATDPDSTPGLLVFLICDIDFDGFAFRWAVSVRFPELPPDIGISRYADTTTRPATRDGIVGTTYAW